MRIPASLCGIVGLKPSQGRVSLDGVVPLAPSLDSVGPMAGTVADVAAAYRAVIHRLAEAGAAVQTLPLAAAPGAHVAPTGQVIGHEAWALHGERITANRATADAGVLRRFQTGSAIDAGAYRAAQAHRAADQLRIAEWFNGADFLLTPATARTAPLIVDVNESDFTLAHCTRMANYLDLCAIAMPCGFDRRGLPIGLQLIGRAGKEAGLIAAAWGVEQVMALAVRLPPMHASRCVD